MDSNFQTTDVIFDLDGTLVDSAPGILCSLTAAFETLGMLPTTPISAMVIGPPLKDMLRSVSGRSDDKTIDAVAAAFVGHYDMDGYRNTRAFQGVEAMLRELKVAGLRLHIATNKRLRPTQLILAHLGWSNLFDAIYATDLCDPPFPNKSEMLRILLRTEGIDRSHAIYIGDRFDDLIAAKANVLPFIAAIWGNQREKFPNASEMLLAMPFPSSIPQFILGGKFV